MQSQHEKIEEWSAAPFYDEIYCFITECLGCNIMICGKDVIMVCIKNFINEPSFMKFIKIGEHTTIKDVSSTYFPNAAKIDDNQFHFFMKSKAEILEKYNKFNLDIEEERKTILFKIYSFILFRFKIHAFYQFHGWKVSKLYISE